MKALIAIGGHDDQGEFKERAEFARKVGKEGLGMLDDYVRDACRIYYHRSVPRWYKSRRRIRDPKVFALNMLAWKNWINRWSMYPKIRVPTLVMSGEKYDVNPRKSVNRIAKLIPNARGHNEGLGPLRRVFEE